LACAWLSHQAEETTGTLGSPSATTTIDGEQLPAPDPEFGGVIKDDALQSTPWWAPRIVPPKDAPNILLIITDDAGFGVPSTFGGVIPTPTMDQIANEGLRYTRVFSTALCSPTRAALITGRNHHSAGFGVISEQSTGFPGYITERRQATHPHALLLRGGDLVADSLAGHLPLELGKGAKDVEGEPPQVRTGQFFSKSPLLFA
jgi:Sulfatase